MLPRAGKDKITDWTKEFGSRHGVKDRPTRIAYLKQGPMGVLEIVKNT